MVGPPAIGCVLLSPGFSLFEMRKDQRKVAWLASGKFREGPDDKIDRCRLGSSVVLLEEVDKLSISSPGMQRLLVKIR